MENLLTLVRFVHFHREAIPIMQCDKLSRIQNGEWEKKVLFINQFINESIDKIAVIYIQYIRVEVICKKKTSPHHVF